MSTSVGSMEATDVAMVLQSWYQASLRFRLGEEIKGLELARDGNANPTVKIQASSGVVYEPKSFAAWSRTRRIALTHRPGG